MGLCWRLASTPQDVCSSGRPGLRYGWQLIARLLLRAFPLLWHGKVPGLVYRVEIGTLLCRHHLVMPVPPLSYYAGARSHAPINRAAVEQQQVSTRVLT